MAIKRTQFQDQLPEGFLYKPEFLDRGEERELLRVIESLPFEAVDFRGYIAKRRVVSYGWDYDFVSRRASEAERPIPDFLLAVRERAAAVAGLQPDEMVEALVTEYPPGAPIGWHRDAPRFETIVGISLASSCRMRLKPYKNKGKIQSVTLEPRSIYVMRGVARWNFQHSIPGAEQTRYSITFRSLATREGQRAA